MKSLRAQLRELEEGALLNMVLLILSKPGEPSRKDKVELGIINKELRRRILAEEMVAQRNEKAAAKRVETLKELLGR